MAFKIPVRCGETTTTTGTGTITTQGAPLQMQTFNTGVGTGNTCPYVIVSGDNVNWERGIGTVTVSAGVTTVARTTVVESSNSNAAISLVGTSFIFVCPPGDVVNANGLLNQVFGNPSNGNYNLTVTSNVFTLTAASAGTGSGLWGGVMSASTPTISNTGLSTSVNLGTGAQSNVTTGYNWTGVLGSGSDQLRGYSASYTAPLTTVTLLVSFMVIGGGTNASLAVGFTDGTKFVTTRAYSNQGQPAFDIYKWTNSTTIGAAYVTGSSAAGFGATVCGPFWLRITDDNTNLKFQNSHDGVTWNTITSQTRTDWMASGPTAWFFGSDDNASNARVTATILSYAKA